MTTLPPGTGIYGNLSGQVLRDRAAAFEQFAEWESRQRPHFDPAQALAGIGFLYDLMPAESRNRPVDPSGVMEFHRMLAVVAKAR